MFRRDYLVKQLEEFGKVMAVLLGLKKEGSLSELDELLRSTSQKYTSIEISSVELIPDNDLLQTLCDDKKLNDEQLKMLADLLFEKAEYYLLDHAPEEKSQNCYKKAYVIYSFLQKHATLNFSLDMHYKLGLLVKMDL
jgi:Family of unknown function (DUF6483)